MPLRVLLVAALLLQPLRVLLVAALLLLLILQLSLGLDSALVLVPLVGPFAELSAEVGPFLVLRVEIVLEIVAPLDQLIDGAPLAALLICQFLHNLGLGVDVLLDGVDLPVLGAEVGRDRLAILLHAVQISLLRPQ